MQEGKKESRHDWVTLDCTFDIHILLYSGVRMKRQFHKKEIRFKIFNFRCRLEDLLTCERIILRCIRKKCVVKIYASSNLPQMCLAELEIYSL